MLLKIVIFSPADSGDKLLRFLRDLRESKMSLYLFPEQFFHYFCSVFENVFDAFSEKEAVSDGPKETERKHVINLVVHIGAGGRCHKGMLVMPELVRAEALLVDEVMAGYHIGNFGHPFHTDAQKRRECIRDDLPGIHVFSVFFVGGHREIHVRGRDLLQIIGR
jgi:hypothetical protein